MAGRRIAAGGTLVLDSEGLAKLAAGDPRARAHLKAALDRRAKVAVSALTLTEVLRGGPRDAPVHQRSVAGSSVIPVTSAIARRAGELLGTHWAYPVTGVPSMPSWWPPRSTWNGRSGC